MPFTPVLSYEMIPWPIYVLLLVSCVHGTIHSVGHVDRDQYIRLKSQYALHPGEQLRLPITVPSADISVHGRRPPRLVGIDSLSPDFTYGSGDVVSIVLVFSAEVSVHGIPYVNVNTGCFDYSCVKKEVQHFDL